jgi:hypothetical protein
MVSDITVKEGDSDLPAILRDIQEAINAGHQSLGAEVCQPRQLGECGQGDKRQRQRERAGEPARAVPFSLERRRVDLVCFRGTEGENATCIFLAESCIFFAFIAFWCPNKQGGRGHGQPAAHLKTPQSVDGTKDYIKLSKALRTINIKAIVLKWPELQ